MAIQNHLEIGILVVDPIVYDADIFHHRLPTTLIHIAKVFRALDRSAVAAMVVDHADEPMIAEELHQRDISLFVFAHAVDKLDNAPRGFIFHIRNGYKPGQFKSVCGCIQREGSDCHGGSRD